MTLDIVDKEGIFLCDDIVILEAVQVKVDGRKIRKVNAINFDLKAIPKLYNYLQRAGYNAEISPLAQDKINEVSNNVRRRKAIVNNARINYHNKDHVLDYDTSKMKWPPMKHQITMFDIMSKSDVGAILAAPGTCKTGPYLWSIDKRIKTGKIKKCLIITLSHLKKNILEEMKVQVPHLKGVVLKSGAAADKVLNKKYKIAKKNVDYDIYIANYESMFSLVGLMDDDMFQMVILDEAHRLGEPKSRQTKNIVKKFVNTTYKFIVSGTLHANNLMSFYMPFRFMGADTLPEASYYEFRRRFFITVDQDERIWVPAKGTHQLVRNIIGKLSVVFEKEDCIDLPGKIYQEYTCAMSPEQQKSYDGAKKDLIVTIEDQCKKCDRFGKCKGMCDDDLLVKSALVLITKLAQITCGFYRNTVIDIDDSGKKNDVSNIITFEDNNKLKLLIKVIKDIPATKKIIVWTTFIHTLETIEKELKKHFGGIVTIHSKDDAFEKVEEFKQGGKRILLANPRKAGTGLNIQFSSYQIFFNNNYSYVQRNQAEGRQDRKGQTDKVTIIDLICDGSVDEAILKTLKTKESNAESLSILGRVVKLGR